MSICRHISKTWQKSDTYWTSHVEVFVRSLRLSIIFSRQGGHPVRRWAVEDSSCYSFIVNVFIRFFDYISVSICCVVHHCCTTRRLLNSRRPWRNQRDMNAESETKTVSNSVANEAAGVFLREQLQSFRPTFGRKWLNFRSLRTTPRSTIDFCVFLVLFRFNFSFYCNVHSET